MKKLLILILVLSLILLSGCKPVSDVEKAIDEIGTVTLDSLPAIQHAETLYQALPASSRAQVSNADVLFAAREEYDRQAAIVQAAVDAIHAIGFVSLDSDNAITQARAAYDALAAEGLTSYAADVLPILEAAEGDFARVFTKAMYEEAQKLYDRKDYANAEETLAVAIARFPHASMIPECKILAGNAAALRARAALIVRDYETAMAALLRCKENYSQTEEFQKAWDAAMVELSYIRPTNGRVFSNSIGSAYGKLTVNAFEQDACIKVESLDHPGKYAMFYVRANESASLYLPEGRYTAKYTYGPYWYGESAMFGESATFTEFDDVFELTIEHSSGTVTYTAITVTLYSVINGNLGTTTISPSDF